MFNTFNTVIYYTPEQIRQVRKKANMTQAKFGKFVDENDEGRVYIYDQWWKCSECQYDYGYKKPEFKFCPNCGAEMEDID